MMGGTDGSDDSVGEDMKPEVILYPIWLCFLIYLLTILTLLMIYKDQVNIRHPEV